MQISVNFSRYRYVISLAAFSCALSFPATAQKPLEPEHPSDTKSNIATVEVTPAQATASLGSKLTFKAVAKDSSGQILPDPVKYWYASPFDASGAEQNGEISFFQPGEITVGALIGNKFGYAHVTVVRPHIAKIDVVAPSAPILVGASDRLIAVPSNASGDPRTDIAFAWTSENSSVATVDAAGFVRALKPGKTKIRATGDGLTSETTVEVVKNSIKGLSVSPGSSSAKTGEVLHFSAKDSGGSAIPAEISWSVQGSGANIWPDGTFVAERPGTYAITAAAGDRTSSASIVVTPRNISREVEVVGHAMPKDEQFAEEWV